MNHRSTLESTRAHSPPITVTDMSNESEEHNDTPSERVPSPHPKETANLSSCRSTCPIWPCLIHSSREEILRTPRENLPARPTAIDFDVRIPADDTIALEDCDEEDSVDDGFLRQELLSKYADDNGETAVYCDDADSKTCSSSSSASCNSFFADAEANTDVTDVEDNSDTENEDDDGPIPWNLIRGTGSFRLDFILNPANKRSYEDEDEDEDESEDVIHELIAPKKRRMTI